ncbi:MAG: type II pantothenate kinase [Candidatus Cyclobacteriaceae bacterium M3_2C_046]
MVLGIDIGGSTTDIACFDQGKAIDFLSVSADDPITSASGALGKFINKQHVTLQDIQSIAVTGVGANSLGDDLFGIPLQKISEFNAIGLGGLYLSGLDQTIVVSMGTGTAIVKADQSAIQHLGGTGVGGGTLLGLSKYMLNISNFETLIELAQNGNLAKVDLTIGDISSTEIGNLPPQATASNFGKHSDKATANDKALGIINLVCQTIGMLAVFASHNNGIKQIVLTGKMIRVPQTQHVFHSLEKLFQVKFITPQKAEFATAVGAAYALIK